MNTKAAEEAGYTFHGAYDFSKAPIVERAKELRAQGNKAVVVYKPADKYSRSGGGGYAIYWKESEANKTERIRRSYASTVSQTNAAIARLEAEIEELKFKAADYANRLADLG
jgi:hypothetical protein